LKYYHYYLFTSIPEAYFLYLPYAHIKKSMKIDNSMPGIIINTQYHVNKFCQVFYKVIDKRSQVSTHKQTRVLSYSK